MKVNISTRHGQLSIPSQEKISAKVSKLTRFHDRLNTAQVTIDLSHDDSPEVEIRVSAEKARSFVATDRTDSLMASIDGAIHKLEQQLKKHKEKVTDHRNLGRRVPIETEPESET